MDLTVIIVSFNTKKLLEDCIDSVYKFTKGLNFEVVVVDNASNDGTKELLRKKFPKVKLIANKKNLGFAKANNRGISVAQGDFLLFLNSDTYLTENVFGKLINKAKESKNLGAIGPLLLNQDGTIQQSAGFFPHLPQIFYWMSFLDDLPGGTILKPYHVDHDSFYKDQREVDWLTGAALFVPKEVAVKTKGFDEDIFLYGEDVEWCYRIKKAGFKILFSPVSKIVHIRGGSSKQISTRAFVGEYNGLVYFYKKYRGFLALQILRLLLKIGALARIVIFGLLGRSKLAGSYAEVFKVAG